MAARYCLVTPRKYFHSLNLFRISCVTQNKVDIFFPSSLWRSRTKCLLWVTASSSAFRHLETRAYILHKHWLISCFQTTARNLSVFIIGLCLKTEKKLALVSSSSWKGKRCFLLLRGMRMDFWPVDQLHFRPVSTVQCVKLEVFLWLYICTINKTFNGCGCLVPWFKTLYYVSL